jgi:hypothetical protein
LAGLPQSALYVSPLSSSCFPLLSLRSDAASRLTSPFLVPFPSTSNTTAPGSSEPRAKPSNVSGPRPARRSTFLASKAPTSRLLATSSPSSSLGTLSSRSHLDLPTGSRPAGHRHLSSPFPLPLCSLGPALGFRLLLYLPYPFLCPRFGPHVFAFALALTHLPTYTARSKRDLDLSHLPLPSERKFQRFEEKYIRSKASALATTAIATPPKPRR